MNWLKKLLGIRRPIVPPAPLPPENPNANHPSVPIYLGLLDRILNENIRIRIEPLRNIHGIDPARFFPDYFGGGPSIHLVRGTTPAYSEWITVTETAADRMVFVDSAEGMDREISIMAHEFGHYLDDQAHHTPVFATDPTRQTPEERAEVLRIENSAWDYARAVLTELNFTNWQVFEVQRRNGLASYDEFAE